MDAEEQIFFDIQEHGFHVVVCPEDKSGPAYAYSIGLGHCFRHPEVLVLGLSEDVMAAAVTAVAREVRAGANYEAREFYEGVFEDYDCTFRRMAPKHYEEFVGHALWFYRGKPFSVYQMVWPDEFGLFPWESGSKKELSRYQPILDR